jgi:hypothetical protein
MIRIMDI